MTLVLCQSGSATEASHSLSCHQIGQSALHFSAPGNNLKRGEAVADVKSKEAGDPEPAAMVPMQAVMVSLIISLVR
jgi:hypothetical protein